MGCLFLQFLFSVLQFDLELAELHGDVAVGISEVLVDFNFIFQLAPVLGIVIL